MLRTKDPSLQEKFYQIIAKSLISKEILKDELKFKKKRDNDVGVIHKYLSPLADIIIKYKISSNIKI